MSGRCEWEVLVLGHEDRLTLAPMMFFFLFFLLFRCEKPDRKREGRRTGGTGGEWKQRNRGLGDRAVLRMGPVAADV